jgi:hypothetical protein
VVSFEGAGGRGGGWFGRRARQGLEKGDPEPDAWTSEVPIAHANLNGCPGLFAFSPQNMRVYIDNIAVTAN